MAYQNGKSYVFNKTNGDLLVKSTLLSKYDLTEDKVNKKIESYLQDQNLLNKEREIEINIEESLKNIPFDNMYIDKQGKLVISIIVKTNENDYNDVIDLS